MPHRGRGHLGATAVQGRSSQLALCMPHAKGRVCTEAILLGPSQHVSSLPRACYWWPPPPSAAALHNLIALVVPSAKPSTLLTRTMHMPPQVQPPSYAVRLEGAQAVRETEAGRLRALAPDEAPSSDAPPVPDAGLSAKFDLATGGKVYAVRLTTRCISGVETGYRNIVHIWESLSCLGLLSRRANASWAFELRSARSPAPSQSPATCFLARPATIAGENVHADCPVVRCNAALSSSFCGVAAGRHQQGGQGSRLQDGRQA